MGSIVSFVTAHWTDIAGVLAMVVIIGERVAAITATPDDDKWFSWLHKALSAVGLKFPDEAK